MVSGVVLLARLLQVLPEHQPAREQEETSLRSAQRRSGAGKKFKDRWRKIGRFNSMAGQ